MSSALKQFAPEAISLFNNMKSPAAMLTGAIVPLGFGAPLPSPPTDRKEGQFARLLRQTYLSIALLTICSDLIAIMWATVAVNQLTESNVSPAKSVHDLLVRDYALSWAGTNAHFVLALFGFMWMVGTRGYLASASKGISVGRAHAGFASSGLLLMAAIVNRGMVGTSFGSKHNGTILDVFGRYINQLVKRASARKTFGVVEIVAVVIFLSSAGMTLNGLMCEKVKPEQA